MKLPFLSVAYFCASHATNIILKRTKSITRQKLIRRCADNQDFTEQIESYILAHVSNVECCSTY